jgi:hypothetical protein
MDTTALRAAYDRLLEAAAAPDLGDAAGGGWDADHVLAHLISVDAGIASTVLAVVSGSRPTYDNRTSVDRSNLARIIAEHPGRTGLIGHVRRQGTVLCDIADQLTDEAAAVLVPAIVVSNDVVVVDQPVPLAGLIDGLATNHIPEHAQQLLDLRHRPDAMTSALLADGLPARPDHRSVAPPGQR